MKKAKIYEVVAGNAGTVISTSSRILAYRCFRDYVEASKYGFSGDGKVELIFDGDLVKDYCPPLQLPTLKNLVSTLIGIKANIGDDCIQEGETLPSISVTLAADAGGWAIQTGDNSYAGSAYKYKHWGVETLYRRSCCRSIAKNLIQQIKELHDY
jgi:hypothetical protein